MPPARSSPGAATRSSSSPERTSAASAWSDAAVHGVVLGAACLVTYELTTHLLSGVHSVAHSDDVLGGMWAVIATVFVYRDTASETIALAGLRIAATGMSLILCLAYLLIARSHPWAWAFLIALGATLVTGLGRADLAITTGITIAVIMIVAELEPHNAWEQPILRLIDTAIGVLVGVGAAGAALRATALGSSRPLASRREQQQWRPANSTRSAVQPQVSLNSLGDVPRKRAREVASGSDKTPLPAHPAQNGHTIGIQLLAPRDVQKLHSRPMRIDRRNVDTQARQSLPGAELS